MKNFKLDKNNILILIIGALSLINIILKIQQQNYLSIVNSVVGLTGVALFLMNKDFFRYLIWTWIAAQAIIIDHTIADHITRTVRSVPILDLSQISGFKLGFYASGNTNSYGLYFNPVVVVFFLLFRKLKTSSYIGRTIGLLFFKGNHNLEFEEGTYATLKKRTNLDGDDNWILGELSSLFTYNGQTYDRILVYAEDGLLTHTFRIIPTTGQVNERINQTLQFERVDWLMIE